MPSWWALLGALARLVGVKPDSKAVTLSQSMLTKFKGMQKPGFSGVSTFLVTFSL